jgi:transposase
MKYLGIDVHVKTSVCCLVDGNGTVVERTKVPTTTADLTALLQRLTAEEELLAGQEIGKLSHFVYDTFTAAGVKLLSFNAHRLRMICSSRKKNDKRDAYWIAKALQSGMMPHPVYIPTGEVRLLRSLLSQREALVVERRRWLSRARSYLQAAGYKTRVTRSVPGLIESAISQPDGLDEHLAQSLDLCARMENTATLELHRVEQQLRERTQHNDAINRLKTIPAVGDRVGVMLYAWIGDVTRFPDASELASYAGIVPSSWQSANTLRTGRITKEGTPQLRSVLVQAGHVLLWRCQSAEAAPLKAKAERVHTARARRKIAVVAAARHILRLAYYILRDGTRYDPSRLHSTTKEVQPPAA